jgi:hypothetical protein
MTVISYRLIKGNQEDRNEYTGIAYTQYTDPEEILVAPPNYTFADDKTLIVDCVAPTAVEEEAK